MIYVLHDCDGCAEDSFFEGPSINIANVTAGIEAAYSNTRKNYEADHPMPRLSKENAHLYNTGHAAVLALTKQADYIAWRAAFPLRPTLREWFIANRYRQVRGKMVSP